MPHKSPSSGPARLALTPTREVAETHVRTCGRGSTASDRACTPILLSAAVESAVKEKHAILVTWAGVSRGCSKLIKVCILWCIYTVGESVGAKLGQLP